MRQTDGVQNAASSDRPRQPSGQADAAAGDAHRSGGSPCGRLRRSERSGAEQTNADPLCSGLRRRVREGAACSASAVQCIAVQPASTQQPSVQLAPSECAAG